MNIKEAIRILSNSQIQIKSDFIDKEYCGQAFSFAVDTLRRISVEKIAIILANELIENDVSIEDIEDLFSVEDLAQSIITYLQQPTEPIARSK